jgi:MFS family permease
MFVVGTFFSYLGPLCLGLILDAYGPRVCSLCSIFVIGIGCALFGISDKDTANYFMPAICLIAFGGPGAQSAIIHLSNLFPNWKATATAIITGSFQLSFIIFLLFDQLWTDQQISYQTLFLGYSFVCVANAVISIFLWPDIPYTFEEQVALLEHEDGEDEEVIFP